MSFIVRKLKKLVGLFLFLLIGLLCIRYILLEKILFPQDFKEYVEKYSAMYHVEPNLVYAVIKSESNFDKDAKSHKSAKGLMQISDTTALWGAEEIGLDNFNKNSIYEPQINIQIGCWYLGKLLDQYGEENTALAAYNAGSGNVSNWLLKEEYSEDGITLKHIPYNETLKYVKKIEIYKKVYEFLYGNA